ncbi:uncharacterized protein [Gossypium hirsutum]|uniref:Tf2-1-like SH3-like domain-containing protein n=1 Tax=Gossypium hirsutum TaxID=3635 RepID=A0ABM2ZG33_GOSHI|nr:uncharacterized protein LOC121212288 [Gossypium hirsutum]
MLRGCVIEFRGSWEDYLPLAGFAYNNSYQSSIGMAPYEALYGQRCRTPTCWTELGERRVLGLELVADTEDNVKLIPDRLKEASDRQIWPVAYQLELPPELGQIHDVFHASMLRRYHSDPSHVVAIKEIEVRPYVTFEEEPIQIIGRDVKGISVRSRFWIPADLLFRSEKYACLVIKVKASKGLAFRDDSSPMSLRLMVNGEGNEVGKVEDVPVRLAPQEIGVVSVDDAGDLSLSC